MEYLLGTLYATKKHEALDVSRVDPHLHSADLSSSLPSTSSQGSDSTFTSSSTRPSFPLGAAVKSSGLSGSNGKERGGGTGTSKFTHLPEVIGVDVANSPLSLPPCCNYEYSVPIRELNGKYVLLYLPSPVAAPPPATTATAAAPAALNQQLHQPLAPQDSGARALISSPSSGVAAVGGHDGSGLTSPLHRTSITFSRAASPQPFSGSNSLQASPRGYRSSSTATMGSWAMSITVRQKLIFFYCLILQGFRREGGVAASMPAAPIAVLEVDYAANPTRTQSPQFASSALSSPPPHSGGPQTSSLPVREPALGAGAPPHFNSAGPGSGSQQSAMTLKEGSLVAFMGASNRCSRLEGTAAAAGVEVAVSSQAHCSAILQQLLDGDVNLSTLTTNVVFDNEVMRNPFYGGWFSVESPDAFRRAMKQFEVAAWPSVVLLDPSGNVVTTAALDCIEDDLRAYVDAVRANQLRDVSIPRPTHLILEASPYTGENHADDGSRPSQARYNVGASSSSDGAPVEEGIPPLQAPLYRTVVPYSSSPSPPACAERRESSTRCTNSVAGSDSRRGSNAGAAISSQLADPTSIEETMTATPSALSQLPNSNVIGSALTHATSVLPATRESSQRSSDPAPPTAGPTPLRQAPLTARYREEASPSSRRPSISSDDVGTNTPSFSHSQLVQLHTPSSSTMTSSFAVDRRRRQSTAAALPSSEVATIAGTASDPTAQTQCSNHSGLLLEDVGGEEAVEEKGKPEIGGLVLMVEELRQDSREGRYSCAPQFISGFPWNEVFVAPTLAGAVAGTPPPPAGEGGMHDSDDEPHLFGGVQCHSLPLSTMAPSTMVHPLRRLAVHAATVADVLASSMATSPFHSPSLVPGEDQAFPPMQSTGAPVQLASAAPAEEGAPSQLSMSVNTASAVHVGMTGETEEQALARAAAIKLEGATHLVFLFGADWHTATKRAVSQLSNVYRHVNARKAVAAGQDERQSDDDESPSDDTSRPMMELPNGVDAVSKVKGDEKDVLGESDTAMPSWGTAGFDEGNFPSTFTANFGHFSNDEGFAMGGSDSDDAQSEGATGLKIQVVYCSADESLTSLHHILQLMPPTWLCLSSLLDHDTPGVPPLHHSGLLMKGLMRVFDITSFPRAVVLQLPTISADKAKLKDANYEGYWTVVQRHAELKFSEDPNGREFPWAARHEDVLHVTESAVSELPGRGKGFRAFNGHSPTKEALPSSFSDKGGAAETSSSAIHGAPPEGGLYHLHFPPVLPFTVEGGGGAVSTDGPPYELTSLLSRGGYFVVLCAMGPVDAALYRQCRATLDEARRWLYEDVEGRKERAWAEPYILHRPNPYNLQFAGVAAPPALSAVRGPHLASSSLGHGVPFSTAGKATATLRNEQTIGSATSSANCSPQPGALGTSSCCAATVDALIASGFTRATDRDRPLTQWHVPLPSVYFLDAVCGGSDSGTAATMSRSHASDSGTPAYTSNTEVTLCNTEEQRECREHDLECLQEFIITPILEKDESQLPAREGELYLACVRLPHRTAAVLRRLHPSEVPVIAGGPMTSFGTSPPASAGATAATPALTALGRSANHSAVPGHNLETRSSVNTGVDVDDHSPRQRGDVGSRAESGDDHAPSLAPVSRSSVGAAGNSLTPTTTSLSSTIHMEASGCGHAVERDITPLVSLEAVRHFLLEQLEL